YLEDRDASEAAAILGCNENTLRWRAMKGLERLRGILGRRQVATLSVAALATFLGREAMAQAPAAAVAAWKVSAVPGAAEGTRAAVVAKGVLNGYFWGKVKLVSFSVAALAGITTAGAALVPRPPEAPIARPASTVQLGMNGSLGGRRLFPDDNPW